MTNSTESCRRAATKDPVYPLRLSPVLPCPRSEHRAAEKPHTRRGRWQPPPSKRRHPRSAPPVAQAVRRFPPNARKARVLRRLWQRARVADIPPPSSRSVGSEVG